MKENVINLKEVRDKIGLTQKETADKLGISLRTYQRYELDGDGIDYKKLLISGNFKKIRSEYGTINWGGSDRKRQYSHKR